MTITRIIINELQSERETTKDLTQFYKFNRTMQANAFAIETREKHPNFEVEVSGSRVSVRQLKTA